MCHLSRLVLAFTSALLVTRPRPTVKFVLNPLMSAINAWGCARHLRKQLKVYGRAYLHFLFIKMNVGICNTFIA